MSGPTANLPSATQYPGDLISRRVRVTGRVQGVYFRDTCQKVARSAGVAGWVANCPDGSVEAVFEGPPTAVEELIAWCRSGPPRASVEAVEVFPAAVNGEVDFTVR